MGRDLGEAGVWGGRAGKVGLRLGKVGFAFVVRSCSCSGVESLQQDKWTSMKC